MSNTGYKGIYKRVEPKLGTVRYEVKVNRGDKVVRVCPNQESLEDAVVKRDKFCKDNNISINLQK